MPIKITFDKEKATHFWGCLLDDKPIGPSDVGWTKNDLAALAGAAIAGIGWIEAQEQAHKAEQPAALIGRQEIEEAVNAARFGATLMFAVINGSYGKTFRSKTSAIVGAAEDGALMICSQTGLKSQIGEG